jgi:hypothetical protein
MVLAGVSVWSWRTLKVRMGTVSYVRFPLHLTCLTVPPSAGLRAKG